MDVINNRWIVIALLATAVAASTPAAAQKASGSSRITKCKDENGKWHYGDFAAQECARSRITQMNEQGIKVKEQGEALSKEEARAMREAKERREAADREKSEKQARDRRLLMTYESIASIEAARDARLDSITRFIRVDEEFLKRLQDQLVALQARKVQNPKSTKVADELTVTEEQIAAYERALASRVSKRKDLEEKFQAEIERYREIQKGQATADNQTLN